MAKKAKDVKMGGGFVELGGDSKALDKVMKNVKAKMDKLGASLKAVGKKMAIVGAGITAALALPLRNFAKLGDQVAKSARRVAFSAQAFAEWSFAAELSGSSAQGLETAIRTMQRSIFDAGLGLSTPIDALDSMNLTIKDLMGLAPEVQFTKIAKAMARMKDPSLRAGAAMKLLGRAGTQMIPLFSSGAAAIDNMRAEYRMFAGEIDFTLAEKLTDALTRMKHAFRGIQFAVAQALAGGVTEFINKMAVLASRVTAWIADHKELIVVIGKLGLALGIVGAAILASPLIAYAAALALILHKSGLAEKGIAALEDRFKSLGDGLSDLWKKITGIMDRVGSIIKLAFAVVKIKATQIWLSFKLAAFDALAAITNKIGEMIAKLLVGLDKLLVGFAITANKMKIGIGPLKMRVLSNKSLRELLEGSERRRKSFSNILGGGSFTDIATAAARKRHMLNLPGILARNLLTANFGQLRADLSEWFAGLKLPGEEFAPGGGGVEPFADGLPPPPVARGGGAVVVMGGAAARENIGGFSIDRQQLSELQRQSRTLQQIARNTESNVAVLG